MSEGGLEIPTGETLSRLADELSTFSEVTRDDVNGLVTVRVTPRNADALPLLWIQLGDLEVVLEAAEGFGGHWELPQTPSDLAYMQDLVESVVTGRVVETFGPRRSAVGITLADGRTDDSMSVSGMWFPAPGWRRWGRRVRYAPYTQRY